MEENLGKLLSYTGIQNDGKLFAKHDVNSNKMSAADILTRVLHTAFAMRFRYVPSS